VQACPIHQQLQLGAAAFPPLPSLSVGDVACAEQGLKRRRGAISTQLMATLRRVNNSCHGSLPPTPPHNNHQPTLTSIVSLH